MPHEKLFTAKQAAEAVLAKAAELAIKAKMKKEEGQTLGGAIGYPDSAGTVNKAEDGMKAAPSTDKNAPGEKAQDTPAGVKASPDPARAQPNENGNPAPGALPQNTEKFATEKKNNGHLKLAMFVGRMAEKRKNSAPKQIVGAPAAAAAPQMDKAETGNEKGVHVKGNLTAQPGQSSAGHAVSRAQNYGSLKPSKQNGQTQESLDSGKKAATDFAKDMHKKVIGEMKSAPKPKLPG